MDTALFKRWSVHALAIVLLVTAGGLGYFLKFSEKIPLTRADTQAYDFSTAAGYYIPDETALEIDETAGVAQLLPRPEPGPTVDLAGDFNTVDATIGQRYITILDSTHMAMAYLDETDSTGKVKICTFSGLTKIVSSCTAPNEGIAFNGVDGVGSPSIAALDSTHLVVVFHDLIDGGVKAIVGTVTGNQVIFGVEADTGELFGTLNHSAVKALSSTTFVAAFDGALNDGQATVGTISVNPDPTLTSIVFGSVDTFVPTGPGPNFFLPGFFDIAPLSATQFVVGYRDFGTGTDAAQANVGTVSGSGAGASIVFGAAANITNDSGYFSLDTLDAATSKIITAYTHGTLTGEGDTAVGTVSGSGAGATISFGSAVNFDDATTPNDVWVDVVSLDADSFWVSFRYAGGGDDTGVHGRVGSVSGTTITYNEPNTFINGGGPANLEDIVIERIDDETVFNAFRTATNDLDAVVVRREYTPSSPIVKPTTGISGFVTSWDGFTETATKPVGTEIYYQISDDGGTTWQYWDGDSWETAPTATASFGHSAFPTTVTVDDTTGFPASGTFFAEAAPSGYLSTGALDYTGTTPTTFTGTTGAARGIGATSTVTYLGYNTADEIDDGSPSPAIASFPATNLQLTFRAFLQTTDYTETPELSNVQIDYTTVAAPTIDFKTNNTYAVSASTVEFNSSTDPNLYIQLNASVDAGDGTTTVTVKNLRNGDIETVTLTETGPTTGIFRGDLPTAGVSESNVPTLENGIMSGATDDEVRAFYNGAVPTLTIEDNESAAPLYWFDYSSNTSSIENDPAPPSINDYRELANNAASSIGSVVSLGTLTGLGNYGIHVDLKFSDPSLIFGTSGGFSNVFGITLDSGSDGSIVTFPPSYLRSDTWTSVDLLQSDFATYAGAGVDFSALDRIGISAHAVASSGLLMGIDNLQLKYIIADTINADNPAQILATNSSFNAITSLTLGNTLYFEVTDVVRAGNGGLNLLVTTTSGDEESVFLTETGPSTGIFQGSISTAGGAGVKIDGTLQGSAGDAIDISILNADRDPTGDWFDLVDTGGPLDGCCGAPANLSIETDPDDYIGSYLEGIHDGVTNFYGRIPFFISFPAPVDMEDAGFSFDMKIDDPSQLSPTPTNFGGLPFSFGNVALLIASGDDGFGEPTDRAYFEISPSAFSGPDIWTNFYIPQSSFIDASITDDIDFSDLRQVILLVITGDGSNPGNSLTWGLDNLSFAPPNSLEAISITATASGGGPRACASVSDVTAFDAQVVSLNTGDVVEMTWVNPTSNPSDFLEVRRGPSYVTDANAMGVIAIIPNTASYYTDNTAAAGQSYSYMLHSVRNCGQVGPSPSVKQVTLPSAIPAGQMFDLHLDLQVKTTSQSDEKVLDTLKDVLQSTQNQVRTSTLVAALGSTIPEVQASFIAGTLSTCAGSTDFLESVSPPTLATDSYFIQQIMRTHLEALLRKKILCSTSEISPFLLQLLEDRLFFIREDAFKYLIESHPKLLQSQPDWTLIDAEVLKQTATQIQDLLSASTAQFSTQNILREALDENLLNFQVDTLQNYEDITSNDTLKETILSIPDIDKLVKGHQTSFTLEIWPKGKRDNPALIDGKFARYTINTNIFGGATLDIDNFISDDYDITINKAKVLRKALNGYTINRRTMALDFTRGLKSREAYIKVGDLNDDGQINTQDLIFAGSALNDFDLNQDGMIDLYDYLILIQNFGRDE